MRRPGSRTGPWAPTSLTRLVKAERRPNGRRGGAVSPADKVDAVGHRGVVVFVQASPRFSLPDRTMGRPSAHRPGAARGLWAGSGQLNLANDQFRKSFDFLFEVVGDW
jgi:hypothetical protein